MPCALVLTRAPVADEILLLHSFARARNRSPPPDSRRAGGTLDAERIDLRHGPPVRLHFRRAPRLRTGRAVRAGQCAVAAAADADVRPDRLDRRGRRRARQGPCPRRARRAPGPLVLPVPLQGRSGDAGLPRGRRPLADARLLPRLVGIGGARPRARRRRGEIRRSGPADASRRSSTASTSSASSARSWCSASPTAGSRRTAGASTRPRISRSACSRWRGTRPAASAAATLLYAPDHCFDRKIENKRSRAYVTARGPLGRHEVEYEDLRAG